MGLCCIWCLKFAKNNNIKLKCKKEEKTNFHSCCIVCAYKNFETTDKRLRDLLKDLIQL